MSPATLFGNTGLSEAQRELLQLLMAEEGIELSGGIPRRPPGDRSPLSFAQQRLWFLSQLDPLTPAYNITSALRLQGDLDRNVLQRALAEMIRRHESLRTAFALAHGEPSQVIFSVAEIQTRLGFVDLGGLPSTRRVEKARTITSEDALIPFELGRAPLLRVSLLRLAAKDHVIVLTMHHIISDAWSLGLLVRELVEVYKAFAAGRPSPFPELPIQYADFALWQRQHLSGALLEGELRHWREQLADLAKLELLADHPRPANRSFRGAAQRFGIPVPLAEVLRGLTRSLDASLFMVTLAVFDILLGRYGNEIDVAVGTPIANRTRVETEGLIGFFVNTLVIRVNLSGRPSFRDLVLRVREVMLAAYAHQDLPFERLVEELQPERDLAHTPLFQNLFVLQNVPVQSSELPGLRLTPFPFERRTAKFDITLTLNDIGPQLEGSWEYNTDLFEPATIQRLVSQYRLLLAGAVERPEERIDALSLLSESERHQLAREWNDTVAPFRTGTLHALIAEQLGCAAEAVSVVFEGEHLSAGELVRRADRLARQLLARGIGPESRVGICVDRSLDLMIGLLAVLKSGGAYVPLDAQYPLQRLIHMRSDSRIEVLLTQTHLRETLAELGSGVICIDSPEPGPLPVDRAPFPECAPENLAYVIYTSGSTGTPKGAMNSHRGIVNRLLWMQGAYRLGAADRVLQKTPVSFDVSVWELFWPLITGAQLVLARPGGHQDSAYLRHLIQEREITTLHFVPSMLQVFLGEDGVEALSALRLVVCSGEALPPALVRRFHTRLRAELQNLYGPTEAAVDVSAWRCELADGSDTVPIGRPIANLRLHLLDGELQEVPIGVAGELFLGGVGLGRGYWNRPDLTALSFLPDHLAGVEGGRLYRTGDLARYLPNGEIEYLGRRDHQTKIRGFRIELGEIERALTEHAGIRECVVIASGSDPLARRLVAYLVANPEQPSIDELRRFLGERLPHYMIPAHFLFLEGLPLTASGKVDRRALPEADGARPELESFYVAPSTMIEEVLAGIWSSVLGIDRVGIRDNFFALGGDSILSLRVIGLAQDRGLRIELPQIFRHQTIAELAAAQALAPGRGDVLPPLAPFALIAEEDRQRLPAGIADAYPMTRLQLGMLYHIAALPEHPIFHNLNSWRLQVAFDPAALQRAVDRAVARHDVLRTSFHLTGFSEPLQLVHAHAELPLAIEDLSALPPAEQTARIQSYFDTQERSRFDLSRPPLIRFTVHRLATDVFQFSLTENHAIEDGWSLHATLGEIFKDYLTELQGEALPRLAPLRTSFRDYVFLERAALEQEEQRGFWSAKLEGCNPPDLPPLASPPEDGRHIKRLEFHVSDPLRDELKGLARRAAVPLKSVLLAAHLKVLSALSGQEDVLTGMIVNGRPELPDGDQIRGLFLNGVPLRCRLTDCTWTELVKQSFAAELELLPYRRFPLAEMQRQFGRRRLVETEFNFINFHVVEEVLAENGLTVLGSGGRPEQTDLVLVATFDIEPQSGRLDLNLRHDTSRLDGFQVRRAGAMYLQLLREMARDPEGRPLFLSALSSAEEQQLVVEHNDTALDLPYQVPFYRLFELQVERRPEAIAARSGGECLTYGEVDRQARRLARELAAEGAGPETVVALLCERSLDLLRGILAVFRVGAAYLPLDPQHPVTRLRQVIEQSGAPLALASEALLPKLTEAARPGAPRVRSLDGAGTPRDPAADERHGLPNLPASLAYVIYTSGSTGVPKGAMVTQQGMVNHLFGKIRDLGLTAADVVAQTASQCFDISVWQFLAPLTVGASVMILEDAVAHDPWNLVAVLSREGVSVFEAVPSLLGILLDEEILADRGEVSSAALRWLLVTGEALPPALAARWHARFPGIPLVNAYGPTECSDDVTHQVLRQAPAGDAEVVPIGAALPNLRLYVADRRLMPLPQGTAGELVVGGIAVGRGYLNDPARTAEVFVPDPFSPGLPGSRLYRTGDLVRGSRDGVLYFLGRLDQQVKIHGFRIELGEIEAVLGQHPAVRESAVLCREEGAGKRLVAYVAASQAALDAVADRDGTKVGQWQAVYDEVYRQGRASSLDTAINLRVWISSYTGEPMGEAEIVECFEDSVARILDLRPKRLLEVGCGTGLLLTRVAPHCSYYCGTDISQEALLYLEQRLATEPVGSAEVELKHGAIDDLRDLVERRIDTVVINEVVHYFPSIDYLAGVLTTAVDLVQPGGRVFVGGIRSLPLLGAFHASVQLHQAPPDLPVTDLRNRVQRRLLRDKELVVDPELFLVLVGTLPRVTGVRIQLKGGSSVNELTKFRYDAVLEVEGSGASATADLRWRGWQEERLTLASLRRLLAKTEGPLLGLAGVPNARVLEDLTAAGMIESAVEGERVDELRGRIERALADEVGIWPDQIWSLARELGWRADISWSGALSGRSFDVLFSRIADDLPAPPLPRRQLRRRPWAEYGNDPTHGLLVDRLVPELRGYLAERLPEYMVPGAWVVLDALPRTVNGKLDRQALAAPDPGFVRKSQLVAPRSRAEELLAGIWSEVLGIPQIGVDDNFFEVGGDSILSLQIVARANRAGLRLNPGQVFQYPTVAQLAAVAREGMSPLTDQGPVTGAVPLTPIQRLFLEQELHDPSYYNLAILLAVERTVDPGALAAVLAALELHHDALRLRFSRGDQGWAQELSPPAAGARLAVCDFRGLAPQLARTAMRATFGRVHASLDLTAGPIWRAVLCQLDGDSWRLLLVVHHLATDGVSWRLLLEDLAAGVGQLAAGQPLSFGPKTASFKSWAERLVEAAAGGEIDNQWDYWLAAAAAAVAPLPVEMTGENSLGSARNASFELDAERTQALLKEAPRAYHTQINDMLLAGLAMTLCQWTGAGQVRIDLEGHGRDAEALGSDLDLSRTVGWYTSIYPLTLTVSPAWGEKEIITGIKEQLRQVPDKGIGYGLLRYLGKDAGKTALLRGQPDSEVVFNYFGQVEPTLTQAGPLRLASEAAGPNRNPRDPRPYLLEISAMVAEGQLRVVWGYSPNRHEAATVERWLAAYRTALERLIDHCTNPDAGGYTPSDFPLARLDSAKLAAILDKMEGVKRG